MKWLCSTTCQQKARKCRYVPHKHCVSFVSSQVLHLIFKNLRTTFCGRYLTKIASGLLKLWTINRDSHNYKEIELPKRNLREKNPRLIVVLEEIINQPASCILLSFF